MTLYLQQYMRLGGCTLVEKVRQKDLGTAEEPPTEVASEAFG